MHDLKAAAKLMLDAAAATAEEMKVFRSGEWHDQAERERAGFLLAAQALEAWAWMAEQPMHLEKRADRWRILGRGASGALAYYYADTPLGAVLAAMEGENDGKEN